MGSATAGRGLALLRLDRVAEALANGQALLAGDVPSCGWSSRTGRGLLFPAITEGGAE